jgi:hypothetical protein
LKIKFSLPLKMKHKTVISLVNILYVFQLQFIHLLMKWDEDNRKIRNDPNAVFLVKIVSTHR